jgi:hypothetical protein
MTYVKMMFCGWSGGAKMLALFVVVVPGKIKNLNSVYLPKSGDLNFGHAPVALIVGGILRQTHDAPH